MSQKIDIRERRYNGVDYDILHPETNINMVLDSSNNSVGDVNGALYGDGNGNIVGASISNPNLLDNPWFTVNQRGFTSGNFADGKYTVDRWFTTFGSNQNGNVVLNSDNSLTFTGAAAGNSYLMQAGTPATVGKTYTISVEMGDGSVSSAYGQLSDTTSAIAVNINNSGSMISLRYYQTYGWTFIVTTAANDTFTLRAVKLEVGTISTLGNDVAPNYTTELLKCQRYFVPINGGEYFGRTLSDSSYIICTVPLPCLMRAKPNIAFTSVGQFIVGGNVYTPTSLTVLDLYTSTITIKLDFSTTTTSRAAVNWFDPYFYLSADL